MTSNQQTDDSIDYEALRNSLEPYIAERDTPEAEAAINEGSHVFEVWSDGEVTMTKGGDLYGKRSRHQVQEPLFKPGALWPIPMGARHALYIVTDKQALSILDNAVDHPTMLGGYGDDA